MNRSSVYYRPKTPDEEARERKEKIMGRIDWWCTQYPTWGARKIRQMLRTEGYLVSRKTVRKYMGEMGIYPIYPKANLSKRNFKEAIVPYLLRNFEAHFPNQAWSIDITYVKLNHRHMYLTAIIDWYSRKIVGWKLSDTLCTKAVLDAVREAVETHGTPAIINSDQGSQFTSDELHQPVQHRPPPHGAGLRNSGRCVCRELFRLRLSLTPTDALKTSSTVPLTTGPSGAVFRPMGQPRASLGLAWRTA